MRNAIITGAMGFVGKFLRTEMAENGYNVIGVDIIQGQNHDEVIDLLDSSAVNDLIKRVKPDVLVHLAGQANVGCSWKNPQKTFQINVIATINILEAIRQFSSATHTVIIGSSDQYGVLLEAGRNVREDYHPAPASPYAVSKMAQEEIARIYASSYGLNICMTRSFNHSGAGQRQGFIIPDFAAGIARIEKGLSESLCVGNLDSFRDYTHVKDIVRAYRLIAEKGKPGEVYNVGSGIIHSGHDVLDGLCSLSKVKIKVVIDKNKMRPSDTPVICCNHDKLTSDTGWMPCIPFVQILSDVLDYYRGIIQ